MGSECPQCEGKIRSRQMESGRWLLSCISCEICFATDQTNLSEEEARKKLVQRYDEGALQNLGKTWVRRHGLGKDLKLMNMGVDREVFQNLPSDIKGILRGGDEVVEYEFMEPTTPKPGSRIKDSALKTSLQKSLQKKGIDRLFEFQEEAIEKILEGQNVLISAPTATGKTEGFILPIFQKIIEEKNSGEREGNRVRALIIYPTKTLSRDQLKKLRELGRGAGITLDVYDGDTSRGKRSEIEEKPPDILITNFDMIHFHLSRRTNFSRLIKSSEWVVIDEIHQYTGAFGSNVHFILKRMERVFYNDFQLIGASATIRNPREFGENLFDAQVEVIECEKGRHGPIHFLMLYPRDRSSKTMLVDCLKRLYRNDRKTVVFGNSHQGVESMAKIARDSENIDVEVHRAGLSYEHRRKVEKKLREGKLRVVTSTPTLELGIDIGDLDAVASVLVGITRFKQRIGRIARRGQEGLAILGLRSDDPISSYYRNHPDDYFQDVDPGYVEPKNPVVAKNQLIAAAMDKPIEGDEFEEFDELLEELREYDLLSKKGERLDATKKGREKLENYSIRGIGSSVDLVYNKQRIGSREMPLAAQELHPGAVYLYAGEEYKSKSFSFQGDGGRAILEKMTSSENIRTNASRHTEPEIIEILNRKQAFGIEILYCRLKITESVDGYYEIDVFNDKVVDEKTLDEPIEYSFETLGFFFRAPSPDTAEEIEFESGGEELRGSFHAVEHAILECSNMFTGGGSQEVGGVAMGTSGLIFVYDGSPGGNGVSKLLYDRFEDAVERSHAILNECACESDNGCPNCTQSYRCGSNNDPLSREGAIDSLEKILNGNETKVSERDFSEEEPIV